MTRLEPFAGLMGVFTGAATLENSMENSQKLKIESLYDPASPSGYVCMLSGFSRVRIFATPWTVARQAPPSMGFSRQEYWMGCHLLLQGSFPTQGLNPASLASPALAGGFFTSSATWEAGYNKPQRIESRVSKRHRHGHVHCRVIHKSGDVETTQGSVSR